MNLPAVWHCIVEHFSSFGSSSIENTFFKNSFADRQCNLSTIKKTKKTINFILFVNLKFINLF